MRNCRKSIFAYFQGNLGFMGICSRVGAGGEQTNKQNGAFHTFDHWKCNHPMTPPVHSNTYILVQTIPFCRSAKGVHQLLFRFNQFVRIAYKRTNGFNLAYSSCFIPDKELSGTAFFRTKSNLQTINNWPNTIECKCPHIR